LWRFEGALSLDYVPTLAFMLGITLARQTAIVRELLWQTSPLLARDKLTPLSELNPIFRVLSRLTAEKMMEVRARTARGRSASLDFL